MHPPTKAPTPPPTPAWECTAAGLASTLLSFPEWGWEAVTVSVDMASYRTIRLPSDSLSRWRWDKASEARTPADTESTEASPNLLPDGGALMWARVSLVSPVWPGLCVRMQERSGILGPGFWRATPCSTSKFSSRSRCCYVTTHGSPPPHSPFVENRWPVGFMHPRLLRLSHTAGPLQSSRRLSQ